MTVQPLLDEFKRVSQGFSQEDISLAEAETREFKPQCGS